MQACIVLFVTGDGRLPVSVDYSARATVTWMFDRIGLSSKWHDGAFQSTGAPGAVSIQVRYSHAPFQNVGPDALAFAKPFGGNGTAVTVMCSRLLFATRYRPKLLGSLLAHVLAHEITHILEVTDYHSETGIMKERGPGGLRSHGDPSP